MQISPNDLRVNRRIGRVDTLYKTGSVSVDVLVDKHGAGWLGLFASEGDRDLYVVLDEEAVEQLKHSLERAEDTLAKYRRRH